MTIKIIKYSLAITTLTAFGRQVLLRRVGIPMKANEMRTQSTGEDARRVIESGMIPRECLFHMEIGPVQQRVLATTTSD
jgi:hypothetical protein